MPHLLPLLGKIKDAAVRERALENYKRQPDYSGHRVPSHTIAQAIAHAFSWGDTPEGYEYWEAHAAEYFQPGENKN